MAVRIGWGPASRSPSTVEGSGLLSRQTAGSNPARLTTDAWPTGRRYAAFNRVGESPVAGSNPAASTNGPVAQRESGGLKIP